jgi:PPOX class probable F420-dependent enzyme
MLNEDQIRFAQRMRVARLATADEDGNPHLIPVCYAYDGTCFYIALDEKPKRVAGPRLRRIRNILIRPATALLIDHYDEDWSQLGYLLVHAQAQLIAPEHPQHTPVLRLLRARYPQYQTMNLEMQLIIMLTPQRVVSWGVVR